MNILLEYFFFDIMIQEGIQKLILKAFEAPDDPRFDVSYIAL